MEQFNTVLHQVLIFLVTIIVGFLAVKLKFLNEPGLSVVSKLFFNVTLPFLIFTNTISSATRADVVASLYVILITVIFYAVLITLANLLTKLIGLKGNRARIFRMCTSVGEMGLVGIPLILAVFGQSAMIYVAMFTLADQLIVWSYGYSLSYPEGSEAAKLRIKLSTFKNLINPPFVAIIAAILVILLGIKLPSPIYDAFDGLSKAAAPLPFLYIGGIIALNGLLRFVKTWQVYVALLVKMLAFPVCVFLLMRALQFPDVLTGIFMIIAGLPAMSPAPMLARTNGSDEEFASSEVIITTLGCLITYPVLFYITSVLL